MHLRAHFPHICAQKRERKDFVTAFDSPLCIWGGCGHFTICSSWKYKEAFLWPSRHNRLDSDVCFTTNNRRKFYLNSRIANQSTIMKNERIVFCELFIRSMSKNCFVKVNIPERIQKQLIILKMKQGVGGSPVMKSV